MQQPGSLKRSGRSQMSASDAEAWARLRLVEGRSSAELWELVHALGQSMLTVGAGPGCSWIVQESGVAPVHFSLHWDGSALRIADTHGVGNLRVDGAPVTAEWRLISGRARIDFGQAAIVVETSTGRAPDLGHPLDRSALAPLSAAVPRSSSHPPKNSEVAALSAPKATLLGVVPPTARGTPIMASAPQKAPASSLPARQAQGGPAQADSFRPKRPSDNARAPKPTLLGMAAQVSPSAAPAGPASTPPGPRPSLNQTLHGRGPTSPDHVATRPSQRVGGASLTDGDQRTMPGFPGAGGGDAAAVTMSAGGSISSVPPGRRETQRGVISVPPGAVPGAVRQMRVKPISDQAPPTSSNPSQRWPYEEDASPAEISANPNDLHGRDVPQAVLVGPAAYADFGQAYPSAGDRLSDAPTEMRDVGHFDARRRRRRFPWHYVGLGALTVLAYAAWLYLLDHL